MVLLIIIKLVINKKIITKIADNISNNSKMETIKIPTIIRNICKIIIIMVMEGTRMATENNIIMIANIMEITITIIIAIIIIIIIMVGRTTIKTPPDNNTEKSNNNNSDLVFIIINDNNSYTKILEIF